MKHIINLLPKNILADCKTPLMQKNRTFYNFESQDFLHYFFIKTIYSVYFSRLIGRN